MFGHLILLLYNEKLKILIIIMLSKYLTIQYRSIVRHHLSLKEDKWLSILFYYFICSLFKYEKNAGYINVVQVHNFITISNFI